MKPVLCLALASTALLLGCEKSTPPRDALAPSPTPLSTPKFPQPTPTPVPAAPDGPGSTVQ